MKENEDENGYGEGGMGCMLLAAWPLQCLPKLASSVYRNYQIRYTESSRFGIIPNLLDSVYTGLFLKFP